MKRICVAYIPIVLVLLLAQSAVAQYTVLDGQQHGPKPVESEMTNQDVISMASLGLSDEVIIDKIRAAETTDFDTSIESLKVLKSYHVSDAVIRAMIDPHNIVSRASDVGKEPPSNVIPPSSTTLPIGAQTTMPDTHVLVVFPGIRLGDSKSQVQQILKDNGWGKWKCGTENLIHFDPQVEHCVFRDDLSGASFVNGKLSRFATKLTRKECQKLKIAEWMGTQNGKPSVATSSPHVASVAWSGPRAEVAFLSVVYDTCSVGLVRPEIRNVDATP